MMNINTDSIKKEFENELYNSVLPFWQKYSIDKHNGGYYNCLAADGQVYDTTKYMWLHGRQIWMFSKLYNTVSADKEWLKIAEHGMNFMRKYAINDNGRVYFSLNEKGEPVYLQRKIFSECFYTLALAEYGRAIKSEELIAESKQMFTKVWKLSKDASLIGRTKFPGETNFQTLAVPMILLNVMEEVYRDDFSTVADKVNECIAKVKMHFVNDRVYENILINGNLHDSSMGRLLNPGHAIEAGWFLKHWAVLLNDHDLNSLATNIILSSFERGWDNEHGGIFYFLDSGGHSPIKLEWDMKLWWPHCEALYALLLIYSETKNQQDWERFFKVKDYSLSHFSDPVNGEWFGYLNRTGQVSMNFKGGPYKGCFHVPRSLYLCLKALEQMGK